MTADRSAAFKAALGDLNSQFASWITAQAASSPHALWCDGARDYVKHAAALVAEFGDALAGGAAAPTTAAAPLFGAFGGTAAPLFGAPASSTDAPAPPAAGGLFGAPPAGGGLFGAPPPSGGGLFGAAPPPSGGLFGAPASGSGAPLFSFGGWATAPPADDDDDDGAPLDDGGKTAAELDASASIAFKTKAKMFAQATAPDGKAKWAERGNGALTVRTPAGARAHIVLTTDTGRVVLNAAVYKNVNALKTKKPHIVAVNLANVAPPPATASGDGGADATPPPDAPKLAPHLLSFDSEPSAAAFIEAVKTAEAAL